MSAGPELAELAADVRAHGGCGFEPCETCTQLVPGEGPASAPVMLVGEAPGAREDESGRPFVGAAGKLLDRVLETAGLERRAVYITNALKARPPGNRAPRKRELDHHRPWLERELELVDPALVVTLGSHSLSLLAPARKVTADHGTLVEDGERPILPLHHPAAALRTPALRATLLADAEVLGELARALAPPGATMRRSTSR